MPTKSDEVDVQDAIGGAMTEGIEDAIEVVKAGQPADGVVWMQRSIILATALETAIRIALEMTRHRNSQIKSFGCRLLREIGARE